MPNYANRAEGERWVLAVTEIGDVVASEEVDRNMMDEQRLREIAQYGVIPETSRTRLTQEQHLRDTEALCSRVIARYGVIPETSRTPSRHPPLMARVRPDRDNPYGGKVSKRESGDPDL